MLQVLIDVYPWDLADEGVETVLDTVQGEVGLTGIVLWVATPPVLQIRRRPIDPRVFRTRGGLGFRADDARYSATRLKPITAEWVHRTKLIPEVFEACARRGLEIRLAVSSAATGRYPERHAEMATKNVFGNASQLRLCLLHPDVQAYMLALTGELESSFEYSCLELADLESRWAEAAQAHLGYGGSFSPHSRCLLGTCWCESCAQGALSADIDVDAARKAVMLGLDRYLAQGGTDNAVLRPLVADDGPVARYLSWQISRLQELAVALDSGSARRIVVRTEAGARSGGSTVFPTSIAPREGVAPDHVAVVGAGLGADIDFIVDSDLAEIHLTTPAVCGCDADRLVARFSQWVERGVSCITVGNYGLMPPETLSGIKRAVRFARRTAG